MEHRAAGHIVATLRDAGCVFAEDEARLLVSEARNPVELAAMVERRVGGLPLEQVFGWAAFCGLRIAVEPGVFVPRPGTELLVREAAALSRPGAVVVDLCCGSGAVGLRWPRLWSGSSCTRLTSILRPCGARAATSPPSQSAGSTTAISTSRCPPRCAATSRCSSPTSPTSRPTRSRSCRARPACTSRG